MRYLDNIRAAREEQRVIGGVPWMPWNNPYFRFDLGGPAHPSRFYNSPEAALGLPALYAGAKLLADSAASLPLRVYAKYTDAVGMPARKLYTGPSMFDRPSLVGTQFDWIFCAMVSCILQGNAWGWITGRDGFGYPTGIEWIPPEDVFVQEARDQRSMNPLDAKVFVYGRDATWYGPDAELFHVKAFGLPGRLEGLSLIRAMALVLSSGHEAQRYGSDWFKNGGFAIGTFQNAEIEVNKEQAADMRAELVKVLRARQPLVYGRDWDYKPVTVPAAEAQFIETQQLTATQVASVLGLPPNRLGGLSGDSLHYSSQAQDALQIIEALRPWLVRFEQAFSLILPRNRETAFYTDALLKVDLQTRMQIYQVQREIGFRTADELRALDDLAPLPDGIGAEGIALELLKALGTRAGAIPKSLMKSVVLEMDVATDRLIKLEKTFAKQAVPVTDPVTGKPTGATTIQDVPIGQPPAPLPLAQDPASFLASLISVQRDMGAPYEAREAARAAYISILTRAARLAQDRREAGTVTASDMLAPWVSNHAQEIVLSA